MRIAILNMNKKLSIFLFLSVYQFNLNFELQHNTTE